MKKVWRPGKGWVLLGGLKESRLIERWRKEVLPLLKARGLVESARGSGQSAIREARVAHEVAARNVERAEVYLASLRELWSSRRNDSVGSALLAILAAGDVPVTLSERGERILRETNAEAIYFHADDVLREAAGATSHGSLLRGRKRPEPDGPVHPADWLQAEADNDLSQRARGGDADAKSRLLVLARMRQRRASNAVLNVEAGVASPSPFDAPKGGRASGVYDGGAIAGGPDYSPASPGWPEYTGARPSPDPQSPEDAAQQRADDLATDTSETEGGIREDHSPEEIQQALKQVMLLLRHLHDDIEDPAQRKRLQTAQAALSSLLDEDEGEGGITEDERGLVDSDSGSHGSPTYAAEHSDEGAAGSGSMPMKREAGRQILADQNLGAYTVVRD